METLTIDRQKWGRGFPRGKLLSPQTGKMCCLGFECLRLGLTEADILNQSMPHVLNYNLTDRLPKWLGGAPANLGGSAVLRLAEMNDASVSTIAHYCGAFAPTSENFREEYIKTMFYFQDVDVVFTN